MLLLLKDHDNIASLNFRDLITLTVLGVAFIVGSALVNLNSELLLLLLDLLAFAVLAHFGWVNRFTLTTAIIARSCPLSVHARSKLHHYSAHTLTLARFARLHGFGVRAADSVTLRADSVAFNLYLSLFAIVQVLE